MDGHGRSEIERAGDSSQVAPNRRRSARICWSTPSRLIMLSAVPATPGHGPISTVGHDLSAHGLACLSPTGVARGTRCTVSIPLADSGLMDVQGVVVRCEQEQAALCLIAVQFDAPLPESVLERF